MSFFETAFRVYRALKLADPRNLMWNAAYGPVAGSLPLPPLGLVFDVAGTTKLAHFLDGGEKAAYSIRSALERHSKGMEQNGPILDFGCGCGRVTRHWRDCPMPVHGTDYNPLLVDWCVRNLPFAQFAVNRLAPPLSYADGKFGLVYALSVFTHLTASQSIAWLAELRRILRPGGWLLFSTHGESYLPTLTKSEVTEFAAGKPVVRFSGAAGSNLCSTFHPPAYIREMTRDWTFIELVPQGALGNPHQDLVILRKPDRV